MKKLLSILLAVLMVISVVPFAYAEENITYEVGDIIEFGSYPQSKVTDETLLTELNLLELNWVSYGYYSGGYADQSYMKYADIEHNNEKYRAVKFSKLRPRKNTETAKDTYSIGGNNKTPIQVQNGFTLNKVYWFKYEPIEWVVINPSNGLLISKIILDSQPYSNTMVSVSGSSYATFYNNSSKAYYATDYYTSSIRTWLNGTFYDIAFSLDETSYIGAFSFDAGSSNATDNVFLISTEESVSIPNGSLTTGGTSYASCQGLYKTVWYYRTVNSTASSSGFADLSGDIEYHEAAIDTVLNTNCTNFGIRPAIILNLNALNCTHKWIATFTTATCTQAGETTFTCEKCLTSYTEETSATGHTYKEVVTEPTCTAKGYTTYTCACGDKYVDDYTDKLDHEYKSEITTEPTHLTEGVKTFTCDCGDTYTESVAKLEGHTYTSRVTKEATHLEEGETTYTCACGDTYTEVIEKLTAHTYEEVVTAPTCTAKGYTTYTCECGDSYISDYVGVKGHSYASIVTTPATHTKEGILTYTCSACGDSYTDSIAKTPDHAYTNTYVVEPTCKEQGYTAHVCECGDMTKDNFTEKTGHSYNGRVCENCGDKCSCMCHYSGFMAFIWKIINFFYKLFRVNKTCACGMIHY